MEALPFASRLLRFQQHALRFVILQFNKWYFSGWIASYLAVATSRVPRPVSIRPEIYIRRKFIRLSVVDSLSRFLLCIHVTFYSLLLLPPYHHSLLRRFI